MVRVAARLFKMSLLSLPPPTISYGGLLPKALSLEMALNWLYLNVTAAVIVDYVAGIDPKALPLLQGLFPFVPRRPIAPALTTAAQPESLRSLCRLSPLSVRGDLISFLNAL